MESLSKLKKSLEENGHTTISFKGYELISSVGRFTMAMEIVYMDNKPLSKQELKEVIASKPTPKTKRKK
jgi:hypothetical protein